MKCKPVLLAACAAFVLPLLSSAAVLVPADLDAATAGRIDAMLQLCAKADAQHRASYERYRSEMIVFGEGTEYEMRVAGSGTPEYRHAHDEVADAARKSSPEEVAATCRRVIEADAGPEAH